MTRTRAACIHLVFSVLVALVVFSALWFVWYPDHLLEAIGGTRLYLIVLAVDVTLGPVLTFVVYKAGKRTLVFDLSVIVLLQVTALFYGLYTLMVARPVYLAGLSHRFDVVQAHEIGEPSQKKSGAESLPKWGPVWVGTRVPGSDNEVERVFFSGLDLGHFLEHHRPLPEMRAEHLLNGKSVAELKKLNPGREDDIDVWLSKRVRNSNQVIFLGLKAPARDMAVILDSSNATVIGIAPFKPWPTK